MVNLPLSIVKNPVLATGRLSSPGSPAGSRGSNPSLSNGESHVAKVRRTMGGWRRRRAEADARMSGPSGTGFPNELNGIGAVGLVDAHRPRRADAVAVQDSIISRMAFCSPSPR